MAQLQTAKKDKPNIAMMREKDKEPVRGIFRFHECPGGVMEFVFKAYKGDEVEKYKLQDGQIYTLPLGVAKHLNKNCWYGVHDYLMDDKGNKVAGVKEKVRRVSFQSLEFVDIDDLTPVGTGEIITVEKIHGTM